MKTVSSNIVKDGYHQIFPTLQDCSENGDRRPELAKMKIPEHIRDKMISLIKISWSTRTEDRPTAKEIIGRLKQMVSSDDEYNTKNFSF